MQSHSPAVAAVILTWNNLADTLDCLDSLQKLDYRNFRVLIVDNGSTDNTVPIMRERCPNARIIQNMCNLGYAEGNNIGISYALKEGADFVLILNNDTIVDPGVAKELITAAQEHPEAAVFCPKIYSCDPPNQIMFAGAKWNSGRAMFRFIGLGEEEKGQYETLSETETASGSAMLLRADVIPTIGYFDARYFLLWEETDWCSRVRRRGYKLLYVPTAKVWHKASRSFGGPGPLYHYYYTRNRLLWIEKNLDGDIKFQAFRRCAKEMYWRVLELRHSNQLARDKSILRAQFRGWLHYVTRQFGARSLAG